jgi:NAD(P)-dependent dehydrogenase (short-subunit alcohol dehydrogenase family)
MFFFVASIGFLVFSLWYANRLRIPSQPKKLNVLITGGTKGLGRALAKDHLRVGDDVLITGRNSNEIANTVSYFNSLKLKGLASGYCCDVSHYDDVVKLLAYANDLWGRSPDLFVANAGCSQSERANLIDTPHNEIEQVIRTNLIGNPNTPSFVLAPCSRCGCAVVALWLRWFDC